MNGIQFILKGGGELKKFIILIFLIFIFATTGNALETRYRNDTGYNNKTGYNNLTGYNNKIPYQSFFGENAPQPEKIKVQKGNAQAVIPIHQKEEQIEQEGIKKK